MARSTRSATCARTLRCRCPKARSTASRSSAGCTGPASTCAPASRPRCPPPSRCPFTPSRSRAMTSSCRYRSHFTVSTLEIRDLHASVSEADGSLREILRGVNLTVADDETHVIMGPNGSGKSTLAYALAGHPKYTVTSGSVALDGEGVLLMLGEDPARGG